MSDMDDLSYMELISYAGVDSAHPGGFGLTRRLLRSGGIKPGSRVLDAGCGTGATSLYLARVYKCKVTALDISAVMLKNAYTRFRRDRVDVDLVQGDVTALPFRDGSFDAIVSESVMLFTPIEGTLREYARVLVVGGVLLGTELAARTRLTRGELALVKRVYGADGVPTAAEWEASIRRAGFRDARLLSQSSLTFSRAPGLGMSNLRCAMEYGVSPTRLRDAYVSHRRLMRMLSHRLEYVAYRAVRG